jgi:hypothetical protein
VTDELCEVVITTPDSDWLVEFTRRLVEDRLAASAHTSPQVAPSTAGTTSWSTAPKPAPLTRGLTGHP